MRPIYLVALMSVVGCSDPNSPRIVIPLTNEIVFTSDSAHYWHVFRMKADGSSLTQLTGGLVYDFSPRVSPDGRSIAFIREGHVYLMDVDGSHLRQLTFDLTYKHTVSWSPDGGSMVFAALDTTTWHRDIYIYELRSGLIRNISAAIPSPSFRYYMSPDWGTNNQIVFSKNDTLYWITPEGAYIRKMHDNCPCIQPRWSPNADSIVFTRVELSPSTVQVDVALVSHNGSAFRLLTRDPGVDADPEWSPEGDRVAFRSARDGTTDIFVMNTAGPEIAQNITRRPGLNYSPSWH